MSTRGTRVECEQKNSSKLLNPRRKNACPAGRREERTGRRSEYEKNYILRAFADAQFVPTGTCEPLHQLMSLTSETEVHF